MDYKKELLPVQKLLMEIGAMDEKAIEENFEGLLSQIFDSSVRTQRCIKHFTPEEGTEMDKKTATLLKQMRNMDDAVEDNRSFLLHHFITNLDGKGSPIDKIM
jgi:hypothetical protein